MPHISNTRSQPVHLPPPLSLLISFATGFNYICSKRGFPPRWPALLNSRYSWTADLPPSPIPSQSPQGWLLQLACPMLWHAAVLLYCSFLSIQPCAKLRADSFPLRWIFFRYLWQWLQWTPADRAVRIGVLCLTLAPSHYASLYFVLRHPTKEESMIPLWLACFPPRTAYIFILSSK